MPGIVGRTTEQSIWGCQLANYLCRITRSLERMRVGGVGCRFGRARPPASLSSAVMLCDNCHQREATCHVCTNEGDVITSRDLCIECYEASSSEAREFAAALQDARCEYCGDEACTGGTDFMAMATGVQNLNFMCMPCSMEHNRYLQQQLQDDASGLSQEEQLALLRKLDGEADKHMKKWVSERRCR